MLDEEVTVTVEGFGDDTRIVPDVGEETIPGLAGSGHENVLLRLGADLLALLAMVPRLGSPSDIVRLREQVQGCLVQMRNEGSFLSCHPWTLEQSGVVFCAALDEAILRTGWGQSSGWANDTLLSRLYGGRNGGELFYLLLDHAQMQPEQLIDFLELQYIILRLGFEGRYHDQPDSRQSICYQLHRTLQRVLPRTPLECRHLPAVNVRHRVHRFRFGMIGTMTLVIVLAMGFLAGYRYFGQLQNQIQKIERYTTGDRT